jgi:hypothetical protein
VDGMGFSNRLTSAESPKRKSLEQLKRNQNSKREEKMT